MIGRRRGCNVFYKSSIMTILDIEMQINLQMLSTSILLTVGSRWRRSWENYGLCVSHHSMKHLQIAIMLKCKKCGFYFAKSCDRKAASIINLLFAPQRLPAHTRARNPQTLSAHLRTLIIQSALGAKSSCQAWWEFYSIFFLFLDDD